MPVDGTIQLAYQDTAWFNDPLNAEIILKEGQHVYLSDGVDEFLSAYVVGDDVTELQDLPWKGLITGVQSLAHLLTLAGGNTGDLPFESPNGQNTLGILDTGIYANSLLQILVTAPNFRTTNKFDFPNTAYLKQGTWGFELCSTDSVSGSVAKHIINNTPTLATYQFGKTSSTRTQVIQTETNVNINVLGTGTLRQISLNALTNQLLLTLTNSSAGIVGSHDFSPNYTPLSFIQKCYLDAFQNGLKWKYSCRASTTTALPTYTPTGTTILTASANGVLPSQDGISLTIGERLLVKNEVAGNRVYNGGYVVTDIGSVSTPWILTRVTDANTSAGLEAATWTIREGTIEGGRTYSVNVTPIIIGTTQITFALTQGPGTYLNGTYLSLSSNVFDIDFSAFDTDNINEGSSNLFFTNARTITSVLTAYAKAAGTISSSDSILQAIQKLDANDDLKADKLITHNNQTSSYTLALSDKDKMIEMDVATANNLTIPLNATVAFPIGTQILWRQEGTGQTTIAATGGVTIKSLNNQYKSAGQYAGGSLIKRGTDEWELYGALTV